MSLSLILSVGLAATFIWAAAAKLVRFQDWRGALSGYGMPARAEVVLAPVVPAAEIGVAAALLFAPMRAGAALALALLASFSLAIMRAQTTRGDALPCGCFGRAKTRDYRLLLGRNALLAGAAAIVMLGARGDAVVAGASRPSSSELVPAALIAVAVVLVSWMAWQVAQVSRRARR